MKWDPQRKIDVSRDKNQKHGTWIKKVGNIREPNYDADFYLIKVICKT